MKIYDFAPDKKTVTVNPVVPLPWPETPGFLTHPTQSDTTEPMAGKRKPRGVKKIAFRCAAKAVFLKPLMKNCFTGFNCSYNFLTKLMYLTHNIFFFWPAKKGKLHYSTPKYEQIYIFSYFSSGFSTFARENSVFWGSQKKTYISSQKHRILACKTLYITLQKTPYIRLQPPRIFSL